MQPGAALRDADEKGGGKIRIRTPPDQFRPSVCLVVMSPVQLSGRQHAFLGENRALPITVDPATPLVKIVSSALLGNRAERVRRDLVS